MRSNLDFIVERMGLNLEESGSIVVLNWNDLSGGAVDVVSGGTIDAVATPRRLVTKGFRHAPQIGTGQVRQFNEIEAGDCVLDLAPDAAVDGKADLSFTFAYFVRAAAATALALSGLEVVDGVQTVEGDRVLAWQQADASQNGIYRASAGVWSRDAEAELLEGLPVYVEEGDTLGTLGLKLVTLEEKLAPLRQTLQAGAYILVRDPADGLYYKWGVTTVDGVRSLAPLDDAGVSGPGVEYVLLQDPNDQLYYQWAVVTVDGVRELSLVDGPGIAGPGLNFELSSDVDGERWMPKPISERLAQTWDVVERGVRLERSILLRRAT